MKRILIVEDENSIADLQRDYLEVSGFAIDIEHAGDTGLQRALTQDYDLVILDIMLPKLDGFEICRQLRKVKNIPVLLVSAKKDDIDKIRGFGLGADDYIAKPFSPSELVARVKAHLARYERLTGEGGQRRDEVTIRGLTIDKGARRAYVSGQEIAITTKEFDLLLFMAEHPNRVFSKDDLFERIWGLDAMGDTATVTVHIRKLREKIESDPSKPVYIETVWGAGYRLNV